MEAFWILRILGLASAANRYAEADPEIMAIMMMTTTWEEGTMMISICRGED